MSHTRDLRGHLLHTVTFLVIYIYKTDTCFRNNDNWFLCLKTGKKEGKGILNKKNSVTIRVFLSVPR